MVCEAVTTGPVGAQPLSSFRAFLLNSHIFLLVAVIFLNDKMQKILKPKEVCNVIRRTLAHKVQLFLVSVWTLKLFLGCDRSSLHRILSSFNSPLSLPHLSSFLYRGPPLIQLRSQECYVLPTGCQKHFDEFSTDTAFHGKAGTHMYIESKHISTRKTVTTLSQYEAETPQNVPSYSPRVILTVFNWY